MQANAASQETVVETRLQESEARMLALLEELKQKHAKLSEDLEASSLDKSSANISSLKSVQKPEKRAESPTNKSSAKPEEAACSSGQLKELTELIESV